MCNETSVVAIPGDSGVELLKFDAGIAFWKVISRQSPTFARSAIGRGRLPGRSWRLPRPVLIVSERNAKTNPFGIVAPSRFNMIACGIATTFALIKREPAGHGAACTGAGTVLVVSGAAVVSFATSVSVLTVVAGTFSVSSFVFGMGAVVVFAAVSGTAAFASTADFSTVAVGV